MVPGWVSEPCLTHLLQQNLWPFPRLTALKFCVKAAAIRHLSRLFPILASLHVTVLDKLHNDHFPAISRLERLRRLSLSIKTLPGPVSLSAACLDDIQKLSDLHELRIKGWLAFSLRATWFSDTVLVHLMKALPHLLALDLDMESRLSTECLRLVAHHYPLIEALHLQSFANISTLYDVPRQPAFPHLDPLRLRGVVVDLAER
jgi:hypothetical protein